MSNAESSSDEEVILFYLYLRRRRRLRRRVPTVWVSDFLRLREGEVGVYDTLRNIQHTPSLNRFENFHRFSPGQFDDLLARIESAIRKNNIRRRDVIPVHVRLSLTLRYLSSGMDMTSLQYLYKVSLSSISRIIRETCEALWDALAPELLKLPTVEEWERIATDFKNLRDWPNCVGCIDGKHVVIQSFNNSGSLFYNYKGTFSIVLMGVCNAHYQFTYVSIGSAGRESDGGVFDNCTFGQMLQEGTLHLPGPRILPGTNVSAPHVFLGDNAFPLLENLMCPYPGTDLHPTKSVFNYRLSRGRRMIENTFGVLANRFRVFRRPIVADEPTAVNIVKAAIVLHNYLITADLNVISRLRQYIQPNVVDQEDNYGNIIQGSWRREPAAQGIQDIPVVPATNETQDTAKDVRDIYRQYFITYGQVPFQWRHLPAHQRNFYDR